MRHSTADPRVPTLTRPGCGLPPLVHRPQGPDERSTTFAHHPCPGRLDPARRWLPATRAAAGPRRSHRRVHRRADPPLHDRARARRAPAGRLQDAPRLPLRALRRGLPGRHLPAHPGRADRRQRRPRRGRPPPMRVRHPHRTVVRPRPRPARAGRPGTGLPSAPERPDLPARYPPVLQREARPRRRPARRTAVPRLLRLHRLGPVQRATPPSCGAGSPSRSAGRWPAGPG